jgi:hypothetical protein
MRGYFNPLKSRYQTNLLISPYLDGKSLKNEDIYSLGQDIPNTFIPLLISMPCYLPNQFLPILCEWDNKVLLAMVNQHPH